MDTWAGEKAGDAKMNAMGKAPEVVEHVGPAIDMIERCKAKFGKPDNHAALAQFVEKRVSRRPPAATVGRRREGGGAPPQARAQVRRRPR